MLPSYRTILVYSRGVAGVEKLVFQVFGFIWFKKKKKKKNKKGNNFFLVF